MFAAHREFGCSAITALTVQSTLGVRAVEPVSIKLLTETLGWLHQDLPPAGIKIGMLATAAHVNAVADFIERWRQERNKGVVVLDPVLRSSSGAELLDSAGLARMQERLLHAVDWVTPNRAELQALTGDPVRNREEAEAAARKLIANHPGLSVVVTGGDEAAPDDLVVLHTGDALWLQGEKLGGNSTHGTGCAYSSALLCELVAGCGGFEATKRAKSYVAEAIRRASPLGAGKGPMNLLWPLGAG